MARHIQLSHLQQQSTSDVGYVPTGIRQEPPRQRVDEPIYSGSFGQPTAPALLRAVVCSTCGNVVSGPVKKKDKEEWYFWCKTPCSFHACKPFDHIPYVGETIEPAPLKGQGRSTTAPPPANPIDSHLFKLYFERVDQMTQKMELMEEALIEILEHVRGQKQSPNQ